MEFRIPQFCVFSFGFYATLWNTISGPVLVGPAWAPFHLLSGCFAGNDSMALGTSFSAGIPSAFLATENSEEASYFFISVDSVLSVAFFFAGLGLARGITATFRSFAGTRCR